MGKNREKRWKATCNWNLRMIFSKKVLLSKANVMQEKSVRQNKRQNCSMLRGFGCFLGRKIHLFAGWAVKRERRKGSSRRQQTAYGAAINEVTRELLCGARSPERKMAAEGTSSTTGRSLLQSVLVSAVDSCHCPHPSHPFPALLPIVSLFPTRFDAFKDVIVLNVHNMLPILGEQPRHLGYRPVYVGFPYDL